MKKVAIYDMHTNKLNLTYYVPTWGSSGNDAEEESIYLSTCAIIILKIAPFIVGSCFHILFAFSYPYQYSTSYVWFFLLTALCLVPGSLSIVSAVVLLLVCGLLPLFLPSTCTSYNLSQKGSSNQDSRKIWNANSKSRSSYSNMTLGSKETGSILSSNSSSSTYTMDSDLSTMSSSEQDSELSTS